MREVSIDSQQQQVHTFWGESQEERVFLWGGSVPPHTSDLNRGPPWGLSVPSSALFCPLGLLLCPILLVSGQMALSAPAVGSAGGGVLCAALSSPPPLLCLSPSPPLPLLPLPPRPLAPQD